MSSIPKKLYHKSNPLYRKSILEKGLIPSVGDSYSCEGGGCPAVFVYGGSIDAYDSTWDDDVYEIDTGNIQDEFKKDELCYNGVFLYTLSPIPREAIKLIYAGSGESLV